MIKPLCLEFAADTPELNVIADTAGQLSDEIIRNKPVAYDQVRKISEALAHIIVDVAGIPLPISEFSKIPDFKHNAGIWQEIREGKYNRHKELTYLPPEIARIISEDYKGPLHFDHLTFISDEVAVYLGKHEGPRLLLTALTSLSDTAALHISKHSGQLLFLDGITSSSELAVAYLMKYRGAISLLGLTDVPDKIIRILAQHSEVGLGVLDIISERIKTYKREHPIESKVDAAFSVIGL